MSLRTPARMAVFLLACLLICKVQLNAQEQPAGAVSTPPIATDRPSVTDSSIVVPAGVFQVENGFLDNSTQGLRTLDGPETLFRFGLTSKTELRFYVPDYYDNQGIGLNAGAAPGSGFGDLAIGTKQQLHGKPGGFYVSVVAYVSLPTGALAISSHGYDPTVQLPWSHPLSPKWTLGGMLSLYCLTQAGKRNLTGEPTLVLARQLTGAWSAFVEYAGDFAQRGGPRNLAHFGSTLGITKRQQLDFHAGVGSMAGTSFHYFGFGYSLLIHVVGKRQ